jgi:hypothetical protein
LAAFELLQLGIPGGICSGCFLSATWIAESHNPTCPGPITGAFESRQSTGGMMGSRSHLLDFCPLKFLNGKIKGTELFNLKN